MTQAINISSRPGFTIEYNPLTDLLVIDGVSCSPDVLRVMLVDPNPCVAVRFWRDRDSVSFSTMPAPPR